MTKRSLLFRQLLTVALIVLGTVVVGKASLVLDIGCTVSGEVYTPGTVYTENQAGVDANSLEVNRFGATSGAPIASLMVNANATLLSSITLPFCVDIVILENKFTAPFTALVLNQTENLLSPVNGIRANAVANGYFGDTNVDVDVDGASTGIATSVLSGDIATNMFGASGVSAGPMSYSLTTDIDIDHCSWYGPIQDLQLNGNLSASAAGSGFPSLTLSSDGHCSP